MRVAKELFCVLALAGAVARAEPELQTTAEIRQTVVEKLESILRQHYQNFDIEVAPLDSRLRLPKCQHPLKVLPMREAVPIGAIAVGVECQGAHPWAIYIKANVRVFQEVAVLTRPLSKGTVLDESAVALKAVDVSRLKQGYFSNLEPVLGKRLHTSLPQGAVLAPSLLASTKVVSKGDQVVIRAVAGALDVRMGGHALADGGLGQKIRVVNDRSQRVIEGTVQGPGEVWVVF
ncbi:MAG: flagellar basal body P-ring formation chaperone FlgA [Methylohalobius sp.]|nr:flagellar basal body P-ring formation chaperone FlgA [Methylohalobius sp.]